MGNRVDGQTQINSVLIPAGVFVLRFVGTCAVFYLFFLCRMIGAGDIKLLAAAALWTSARTLDLLLITAWAGGVLALLYLCLNLVRTRRTTEIPYGVAVSLSLLLMLTHMV